MTGHALSFWGQVEEAGEAAAAAGRPHAMEQTLTNGADTHQWSRHSPMEQTHTNGADTHQWSRHSPMEQTLTNATTLSLPHQLPQRAGPQ